MRNRLSLFVRINPSQWVGVIAKLCPMITQRANIWSGNGFGAHHADHMYNCSNEFIYIYTNIYGAPEGGIDELRHNGKLHDIFRSRSNSIKPKFNYRSCLSRCPQMSILQNDSLKIP